MGIDVDYIYHPQLCIQNGTILTNQKPRSISQSLFFLCHSLPQQPLNAITQVKTYGRMRHTLQVILYRYSSTKLRE